MKIKNLKLTSKVVSLSVATTLTISVITGCTTTNIYTFKENVYTTENTSNNSNKPNSVIVKEEYADILEISFIRMVDDNFIEITTLDGKIILCLVEDITFLNNSKIIITNNNKDNNMKTKIK